MADVIIHFLLVLLADSRESSWMLKWTKPWANLRAVCLNSWALSGCLVSCWEGLKLSGSPLYPFGSLPHLPTYHDVLKHNLILWSPYRYLLPYNKTAFYWPWMVFFEMLARCYCWSTTMSYVLLPWAERSITLGSPSWGMIKHFVNSLDKCFGWLARNPQNKSGKWVEAACRSQAGPCSGSGLLLCHSRAL